MRETHFIKQNKDKWREFEQILKRQHKDPDKLNKLFIQITDDLSFSRTFYPNRSVRVYLNNLAQQVFQSVYKNKKSRRSRLIKFWTDELPRLIYESRKEFRVSFLLFVTCFVIGVVSSANDAEFPRVILGDAYVEMTIENIESGDPMAVYKQKGQFGMSMGITINNLFVAFLTFVTGVFFGIGSCFIMVQNAIMVGAFQYFFYEKGLLLESFLTIWIHGTLEISAIIIAGAAGLTLGKGLVFPGTYSRIQAFQLTARRGLKIMLGIIPVIVMAGFIEGYLTRYTETPDMIRATFILTCLFFVVFYFVWLPRHKAKKGFGTIGKVNELPPNPQLTIDLSKIQSNGEIFANSFRFYRKFIIPLAGAALLFAGIFCLLCYAFAAGEVQQLFVFQPELFSTIQSIDQFFHHGQIFWLPVLSTMLLTAMALVTYAFFLKVVDKQYLADVKIKWWQWLINFLKIFIPMTLVTLLMMSNEGYTAVLMLSIFPVILLWMFIMLWEEASLLGGLARSFYLLRRNYFRLFGLYTLLICLGILFLSITDTQLYWLFMEMISINFTLGEKASALLVNILLTFTVVMVLYLTFALMFSAASLLYFTLVEIWEAPNLLYRIRQIGKEDQIQGMERE